MTRRPEEKSGTLRSEESLRRIAQVLDLPRDTFFAPDGELPEAMVQAAELLRTFNTIQDPQARAQFLECARAAATKS